MPTYLFFPFLPFSILKNQVLPFHSRKSVVSSIRKRKEETDKNKKEEKKKGGPQIITKTQILKTLENFYPLGKDIYSETEQNPRIKKQHKISWAKLSNLDFSFP